MNPSAKSAILHELLPVGLPDGGIAVTDNCCSSANQAAASAASTPQLASTLTCPQCGHVSQEVMPTDACVYFHECAGCQAVLKPRAGDCCVFCSYGSVPCPPIQAGRACC